MDRLFFFEAFDFMVMSHTTSFDEFIFGVPKLEVSSPHHPGLGYGNMSLHTGTRKYRAGGDMVTGLCQVYKMGPDSHEVGLLLDLTIEDHRIPYKTIDILP